MDIESHRKLSLREAPCDVQGEQRLAAAVKVEQLSNVAALPALVALELLLKLDSQGAAGLLSVYRFSDTAAQSRHDALWLQSFATDVPVTTAILLPVLQRILQPLQENSLDRWRILHLILPRVGSLKRTIAEFS